MYIDFSYYMENGGTITDEATFNSYNQQAQNYVDYYTFERLEAFEEIPNKVKSCLITIINKLYSIDSSVALYEGKTASSISNSGISVSFPTTTETQLQAEKGITIEQIINHGLYGVRTDSGLLITYRGV